MGHKDIKMTMRYAHLADDVKQEAVNLLNGLTSKKDCHKSVTNGQSVETTNTQLSENIPVLKPTLSFLS